MNYEEKLNNDFMENKWNEAVNQSEIYTLIMKHFTSPLAQGKSVKKAAVIGYDGMTAEMLGHLDKVPRGAMKYILENGGHAVFSYAGGKPYPEDIIQETSTASGWCSMLTGVVADVHKIDDNGIVKEIEPKSLFLSLLEKGLAKKTAFYVSWGGHFEDDNSTYLKELEYIKENGLNAVFLKADNDAGTFANTISDIKSDDCSDFIFTILEYPDRNGHGFRFEPEIPEYMQALVDSERDGMDIIEAIESRENYEKEDWLILVSSDHGGFGYGHGGPTLQERITFIVSNKEIDL